MVNSLSRLHFSKAALTATNMNKTIPLAAFASMVRSKNSASNNAIVTAAPVAKMGVRVVEETRPNHSGARLFLAMPYMTLALMIICTKALLVVAIMLIAPIIVGENAALLWRKISASGVLLCANCAGGTESTAASATKTYKMSVITMQVIMAMGMLRCTFFTSSEILTKSSNPIKA